MVLAGYDETEDLENLEPLTMEFVKHTQSGADVIMNPTYPSPSVDSFNKWPISVTLSIHLPPLWMIRNEISGVLFHL